MILYIFKNYRTSILWYKINEYLNAYTKFGQRFFRKLVCMKPGSRHPTVRAGEPASENNQRTTL